mmetsp:Transcript_113904/g.302695  ORF Transcript_113904/g.302695 Transcript_113904/m.302695 type:complete len:197 (-) Transcript_113904:142-732(-)
MAGTMMSPAELDAALASGTDHPLHQLLLEPQPRNAQERREQMDALERLMIRRPQATAEALSDEPLDADGLHRALRAGDVRALAHMDRRLQALLNPDDLAQLRKDGELTDPKARQALKLYCESFMSLEAAQKGVSCSTAKEAFQAVMQDDAEALASLLDAGASPELKNAGGHTLLDLAHERGKFACKELLQSRGATR